MKNDKITEKILKYALDLQEYLVNIRRTIHSNPELGYEEHATCTYIKRQLEGLDIDIQTLTETDVVALIKGNENGKTLLIRADIDALPIEEKTGLSFSSKNFGKMHACGHDAHTAILIGAVKILSQMRENLKGNIKFLFQPAEEAPNGARTMVDSGVLKNPDVAAAVATHVWPDIPAGKYGVRVGGVMAAPDFYFLKIQGKGGHGAQPEKCIDPILIGHEIYEAFQNIPTHTIGVLTPVVVSVTKFQAGTANNVFPDVCLMEGTVRSYDKDIHPQLPSILEKIIKSITERHGALYEFNYRGNCPSVNNDATMADIAANAITKLFGPGAIVPTPYAAMGGDDFSVLIENVPGVYFWTGIYNDAEKSIYPLHHPKFTIDENILSRTSAVMAQIALDYFDA